jgi:hypothetical protein
VSLSDARLVRVPGDSGLVCRNASLVLFVAAREPRPVVEDLVNRCRAAHGEARPGAGLVDDLAALVLSGEHPDLPPFAVVGQGTDGVVVAAYGAVQVRVTGGAGTTVVSGTDVAGTVARETFVDPPTTITATRQGNEPAPPDADEDLWSGLVAADGFTFVGPAVATPPAPEFTFEVAALMNGPRRAPLPMEPLGVAARQPDLPFPPVTIKAAPCTAGHGNDPRTRFCGRCGSSVLAGLPPIEAPRPPLGSLVFDDGTTWSLSADLVAGRQPELHERVTTGWALPLVVDDPERSISRVHAEFRLDGWDVVLINLSTTNGSFLWDPATGVWDALDAGEPVVLAPGARIALGRRTAVFESPLRR